MLLALLLPALGPAAGEPGADRLCAGAVATIVGTPEDDHLQGTDGDDVVWLGRGSDRYDGLGGEDTVCAGPGADSVRVHTGRVQSGRGRDRVAVLAPLDHDLAGGPGVDRVTFTTAHALEVDVRSGEARYAPQGVVAAIAGFEQVVGGLGHDVIRGSGDPDLLVGGDGRDLLVGRGGDDVLQGGFAADEARGGDGTDTCVAEVVRACEE